MSDNLSPLSNSTSALLESWIWSECSHGYFAKFPHWCTPVGNPHHSTGVAITGHLGHNNTVKWKANKVVLATLQWWSKIRLNVIYWSYKLVDLYFLPNAKRFTNIKEWKNSTCWLVLVVIVKLWFLVLLNLKSHIVTHPRVTNGNAHSNVF